MKQLNRQNKIRFILLRIKFIVDKTSYYIRLIEKK